MLPIDVLLPQCAANSTLSARFLPSVTGGCATDIQGNKKAPAASQGVCSPPKHLNPLCWANHEHPGRGGPACGPRPRPTCGTGRRAARAEQESMAEEERVERPRLALARFRDGCRRRSACSSVWPTRQVSHLHLRCFRPARRLLRHRWMHIMRMPSAGFEPALSGV